MAIPFFLSCACHAKALEEFPGSTDVSKDDSLKLLQNAIGKRNRWFISGSGQQSSAEFLTYLLNLLRLESELLNSLALKPLDDVVQMSLDYISKECNHVNNTISSNPDKFENPIDDFFYNSIEISHKCNNCGISQFKRHESCLVFEALDRSFTAKEQRSQVTTEDLLDLFLFRRGATIEALIDSFDICQTCYYANGVEEMNIQQVAKEVVIIYDRINSDVTSNNLSILSPVEVISLGQKSLNHWDVTEKISLHHQLGDQDEACYRWRKGAIYHYGPSYNNGHYVAAAIRTDVQDSSTMLLFNDSNVDDDYSVMSLLHDKSSSLIDKYGTAVIALYSSCKPKPFISPREAKRREQKRKWKNTKYVSQKKKKLVKESVSWNPSPSQQLASLLDQPLRLPTLNRWNAASPKKDKRKGKAELKERRFTFDCTHEDYENSPHDLYNFKDFHRFPETAVMLNHFNAGRYTFHNLRDDLSDKNIRIKIANEIKEEFVSNQAKENIISDFDMRINGGVNKLPTLISCGCCGIREYIRGKEKEHSRERGGVRYKMAKVQDLSLLRYTEDDQKVLENQMCSGLLSIPINDSGEIKAVLPEHAISYFYDKETDKYYHLHREFVTLDNDGVPEVTLCLDCHCSMFPEQTSKTAKNKAKKPKLSLAAGYDFGDYNRLSLTAPNKFEVCILSKVRHFITVIKVKDNMGQRRDFTQQVLKGHSVVFDHDAPVITSTVIEGFGSIKKCFRLQLICENGKKDYLVEKLWGSSVILGRPFVIRQWLLILKRINILYQHDDVPDISTINQLTDEANSYVIENIILSHDEKDIHNELVEGDDIAQVRTERVQSKNDSEEESSLDPLQSLSSSYITSGNKQSCDKIEQDPNRLKAILKLFHNNDNKSATKNQPQGGENEGTEGDSNKETQPQGGEYKGKERDSNKETIANADKEAEENSDPKPIDVSKRRLECLNEFTSNEKIIASSFFPIFLLGKAYLRDGSLLPSHHRHLMLQYTSIAGSYHDAIFFLFDQVQRHGNIKGVNSVVRSHKDCFDEFTTLVSSKKFRKVLHKAKKDPNGKEASKVMKLVAPILTTGGNRTCLGSLERNDAISKINAMCLRYGMPTLFLTVAVDDINNFNSFRLELRSVDNSTFPAHATDTFATAMRSNSKIIKESTVTLDCTRANRARSATNSPFAVAHEYIHIITNVFKVFLGLQPTKNSLLHNKKNHSTYYKEDKRFGLFGHALAAIGMNETSQRGALHHHLCAWLGLQSRLLEAAAAFPDLVKEIGAVIDSQYTAELEKKDHVLDLLSARMTKSTIPNKPKLSFCPPALQCRPCATNDASIPYIDDTDFKRIYSYNATRLNIHKHSFTCFKGGSGKVGCRMSFPQPLIKETVPVQLTINETNGKTEKGTWKVCPDMVPTRFNNIISPTERERITFYELKRGTTLQIPDIPDEVQYSDDDTLKNYVINILQNITGICPNDETTQSTDNEKAIMKWLSMFKGSTLFEIYKMLQSDIPGRNGLVVPFNDVITTVLGCNTSVQFLGNQEQSKNTLYYLVPYLTKDNVSLSNCIPVIKKAYEDVVARPSVAEDSGTDYRFAKHMTMRILNILDTKMEISDTQATAALLGMEAQVVTDIFWYITPSHHIQFVKLSIRKQPELMNFNDTDEDLLSPVTDDDDSESLSVSSIESDDTDLTYDSQDEDFRQEVLLKLPQSIEDMFVQTFPKDKCDTEDNTIHQNKVLYVHNAGRGTVFKRSKGLPEITIQHGYHYFYRGEHFADFNRLEYYTLVQIVERQSKASINTGGAKRGVKSERFPFAEGHVLFETHVQMLRFHQPTPIFSNHTYKPKHPGTEILPSQRGYKSFIKNANAFALYYLTLFRPESEHFNAADKANKYKYDWVAFKMWVADLENDNSIISHCRLIQLDTHIEGLKTNTALRTIAKNYRDRDRRIWTQDERSRFKIIDKNTGGDQGSRYHTFDPEDYDIQHSMTIRQFRIALKMTSYGLTQMSLLHRLCPLEYNATNPTESMNETCTHHQWDTVYRQKETVNLIEISSTLYEQNIPPRIDEEQEETVPSLLDDIFDTNAEEQIEYRNDILHQTQNFVRTSIENDGNLRLGASQRKVINYWIEKLCTIKTAKVFGTPQNNDNMPLILLLGLPGTGKSFVINAITECVSFLDLGKVLKTAHYGVAAMNISGSTLHKLFKINFNEGLNSKTRLRDQDLIDLQRQLKSKSLFMLIIDEISNVPPHLLQRVNQRLQELRNCEEPFGGLAVLLVGDFLQKKPPGSLPLVHGLMYLAVTDDIKTNKNSAFVPKRNYPYDAKKPDGLYDSLCNTYLGLTLFENFQLLTLKEQQRASTDNEHMKLLEKLSLQNCKAEVEDFNLYNHLSKDDMNGDFQDACFIVSTNRERHNISFHMARLFAIRNKCPIIRWPLEIKGWMNRPSMTEELDLINKDPIFHEHFVRGMDCYLNENINTPMLIGNGTKVKLHSLAFKTQEEENCVISMIENAMPGQIITLPFTPLCINVELYRNQITNDIKTRLQKSRVPLESRVHDSSGADKLVISILKSRFRSRLKAIPTTITSKCFTPARVFIKPIFPLQLSAAVTVDKAQGRTLDKVVACLSNRDDNLYEMDINSIFVTLSRVRKRSDLRLLIHDDTSFRSQLRYLETLSHDKEYFDYMRGFEENEVKDGNQPQKWNREKALSMIIQ